MGIANRTENVFVIKKHVIQALSKLKFKMGVNSTLEGRNFQVLMLVQALVGAISPNFRMVALCLDKEQWVIKFYLETDIEEDIEEIEEVIPFLYQ